MSSDHEPWRQYITTHSERNLSDLVDLLKIPSVSAVEAYTGDVMRAALWVAERLKRAGAENIAVLPTGPHSVVYADWMHAPGKPTVLLYGHFDVQPADPLELWVTPPFEPRIQDGRIYARGATDMKGNLLLCIIAFEALLATEGALPVNVKFLFEGQEEIGSRDLGPFVAANKDMLACDLVLTPDGLQWAEDQPSMMMGCKGMCSLQIDIETAAMDLHSGLYGGAVPNAVHSLVSLLSSLRDEDGSILVNGFYDDVAPLTALEREEFLKVPFDSEHYCSQIGIEALVGEPGYSTYERAWARPTLEINGVWGGYQGDGVKTVIPAQAHAKITCRLVANQDPDRILNVIEDHLTQNAPSGAKLKVTRGNARARAYYLPSDNPGAQAAADVLAEDYGKAPYYTRVGGSLPITDMFLQELNAYTVDVGFGLDDERAHSPNEFMRLASYERGQIVYARLLKRIGALKAGTMGPGRVDMGA